MNVMNAVHASVDHATAKQNQSISRGMRSSWIISLTPTPLHLISSYFPIQTIWPWLRPAWAAATFSSSSLTVRYSTCALDAVMCWNIDLLSAFYSSFCGSSFLQCCARTHQIMHRPKGVSLILVSDVRCDTVNSNSVLWLWAHRAQVVLQGDVRAYSGVILCIHLTVFHIAAAWVCNGMHGFNSQIYAQIWVWHWWCWWCPHLSAKKAQSITSDATSIQRKRSTSQRSTRGNVLLSPMWHGPHVKGMSKYQYHVQGPISSIRGSLTGFSCREANTRAISSTISTVKYKRRATVDFVAVARCCERTDSFYSSHLYLCLFRIYPYLVSIEQTATETNSALAFGAFLQGRCSWRW